MGGDHDGPVLFVSEEDQLDRVRDPDVQAVVWCPPELPEWLVQVAAAVREGRLELPRTVLDGVTVDGVAHWLDVHLPVDALPRDVLAALRTDVLRLVERSSVLTGSARLMVRILTATPNRRCGFHVDTIPPGSAPWGLLRVYNGAGTAYVDSSAVTAMRDFYRYLGRRERLVRDLDHARERANSEAERLETQLKLLDAELVFLRDRDGVSTAPAGSVVAFTHLEVQRLWSDHAPQLAWIHCSPMAGEPRLVVNVRGRDRLRRPVARDADASAR